VVAWRYRSTDAVLRLWGAPPDVFGADVLIKGGMSFDNNPNNIVFLSEAYKSVLRISAVSTIGQTTLRRIAGAVVSRARMSGARAGCHIQYC
jgi:hypothetical protein